MENVNKQLLDAVDLLKKHQLWINKLPVPTAGATHQMMNVVGKSIGILEAIAAAEQAQQAEPVAQPVGLASEHEVEEEWFSAGGFKDAKTGMMVMPQRDYFFFRMDIRLHPNVSNQRAFCEVRAKYRQPPAVAVPDGWRDVIEQAADKLLDSCAYDLSDRLRAMLAAAPQGVDSSVQVADEKECLHDFVMFRNECVKCGQPYDAAQKGGA